MLAADGADPGKADAVGAGNGAERRAGLDGLQLLRIAHEHHLGARLASLGQHAAKLAAADHARLIDHQHVARAKPFPALRPRPFERGDGPALDPGVFLQALGGLARQCRAAHLEPLALESGLGRLQHPALASARGARHGRDPLPSGHMPHRAPLLVRQVRVRGKRGVDVLQGSTPCVLARARRWASAIISRSAWIIARVEKRAGLLPCPGASCWSSGEAMTRARID